MARARTQLRPICITRPFTRAPAGSVLWSQGNTVVLCTASITQEVPAWFEETRPGGWVTAEYVMLPASTPQRKPWPRIGHTDSRGTEIQRLVGRALRAVVDLTRIGPHTITVDCQVLQADGGTRTAAVCAGYLALVDALGKLPAQIPVPPRPLPPGATLAPRYDPAFYDPSRACMDQLAAVSVGLVDGQMCLDPDYESDSRAEVDMNVAFTASGRLVELQAAAEHGCGFDHSTMDSMLALAQAGCRQIMELQSRVLRDAAQTCFGPVEFGPVVV